ncbi:hypothetical protein ACA910_011922 [Epithemia clementina (nom. ined.)]
MVPSSSSVTACCRNKPSGFGLATTTAAALWLALVGFDHVHAFVVVLPRHHHHQQQKHPHQHLVQHAQRQQQQQPKRVLLSPSSASWSWSRLFMGGTEVTTSLIKELREATGAGMMDCKKALVECDGDREAASEYLRTKGLAKADKKATRVAAEGRIALGAATATDSPLQQQTMVLVEINCETDFVAKDSNFVQFCQQVAQTAVVHLDTDTSVESLLGAPIMGGDDNNNDAANATKTVEEERQALVAKIGENIQVRRLASRGSRSSGSSSPDDTSTVVGAYIHMNRIGVLVELLGGTSELATDVAMHVAALNPPYATPDQVPANVLDKERSILTAQALESGKPASIVEKMVEGRIRKYLQDICCVSQPFVKDDSQTIQQLLTAHQASMVGFTRLAVGEGLTKKVDDFAQEVAKMAGTTTTTTTTNNQTSESS